jgi:hypothetical protein
MKLAPAIKRLLRRCFCLPPNEEMEVEIMWVPMEGEQREQQ